MKGMLTCKICGRDFVIMAEEHYIAQDPKAVGAVACLVSTDVMREFDAFDCPHCGCQNITQERKPVFDGLEAEEEEEEEFEDCIKCYFNSKREDEEPCKDCKHGNRFSNSDFFRPNE